MRPTTPPRRCRPPVSHQTLGGGRREGSLYKSSPQAAKTAFFQISPEIREEVERWRLPFPRAKPAFWQWCFLGRVGLQAFSMWGGVGVVLSAPTARQASKISWERREEVRGRKPKSTKSLRCKNAKCQKYTLLLFTICQMAKQKQVCLFVFHLSFLSCFCLCRMFLRNQRGTEAVCR